MQADSGIRLHALRGRRRSNNNFLMQFQSDISRHAGETPGSAREVTALGAAYLAGLAVGYWQNLDELQEKPSLSENSTGIETTERNYRWWLGRKRLNVRNGAGRSRQVRSPSGKIFVRGNSAHQLFPPSPVLHCAPPFCYEFVMRRELAIEFSPCDRSGGAGWLQMAGTRR